MNYGLNKEQWAAVTAVSPVVVVAAAGSGKTRCLIAKIRYLLDSGVAPQNICGITFTNKAAKEMKNRLKQYSVDNMQISTIHSMCVKIIKTFTQHTYLRVPFSIYDDGDQLSVVKTIIKARSFPEDPYEILSAISRAKSEDEQDNLEGNALIIYKQYSEILKKNNACDFDDLLILARNCLKHNDCRDHYTNKWTHIMVDEVQDTSKIQYEIILALYDKSKNKTLMLIGDGNQSIYSWRGARPENIKNFTKEHKPTECSLTYNYRSSPSVIAHANSYLQFGAAMVAKSENKGNVSVTQFASQDDEAEKIAQALLRMGGGYEETAILYRMNSRSLLFERAFAKNRIPYKVVGDLPFYKRRVVKDLICALKASNNPDDIESLARIINNPKRGFGAAKKELLFLGGRSYLNDISEEMPLIKGFIELLNEIKGHNPLDALNEYLYRTNYRKSLSKDSELNMVAALLDVVSAFDTVDELILASTFLEKDSGKGVKLMSAHASKGLEFDRVFIVGVENEIWPHKNSEDLAEESRLFFVASTRSRRYLNISFSHSRLYRGTPIETFPSKLFKDSYKSIMGKDMEGH